MTKQGLDFTRDRPLRGVDGPTPDYVAPQTGSKRRIAQILGGLAAVSVAVAIGIVVLAGAELTAAPEARFVLANTAPILSLADDGGCKLVVTAVVSNPGTQALEITGTSLALRQISDDGQYAWPDVAGEIPKLTVEAETTELINAKFPASDCSAEPADLFPRDWSIHYNLEDQTAGSSEIPLTR